MNPDVKQRWQDALTDDSFEQGTGWLVAKRDGQDRYCCLGVLTELYMREHDDVARPEGRDHYRVSNGVGYDAMPPEQVCSWAGLDDEEIGFLAEMNDIGASFGVISMYIGKHL